MMLWSDDDKGSKSSGWVWFLTLIVVYLAGLLVWASMFAKPDNLVDTIETERTFNSFLFSEIDAHSWKAATDKNGRVFQILTDPLAERAAKGENVVEGKKGILEKAWSNSPESISLLGLLFDYRLHAFTSFLPVLFILLFAAIFDGLIKRKIKMYKNSFTSPTKHTLGGRLLGVNSSIILVLLTMLPISVPLAAFLAIFSLKALGWWIWVGNLPKRI